MNKSIDEINFYYLCRSVMQNKNELLSLEIVRSLLLKRNIFANINCLSFEYDNKSLRMLKGSWLQIFYLDAYNIQESINLARQIKKENATAISVLVSEYKLIDYDRLVQKEPWIDYILYDSIETKLTCFIWDLCIGNSQEEGVVPDRNCDNRTILYDCREDFSLYHGEPILFRSVFEQNALDFINIDTHSGCAASCSFCEHSRNKSVKKYKRTSIQIVDEIEYLMNKYHIYKFCFTAPSFFDYGKSGLIKAEEIFEELIKRRLDVSLNCSLRAEQINMNTLPILLKGKKAGLDTVLLGLESINSKDLELYQKKATVFDNLNAYDILKKNNIYFTLGFIPFNPYTNLKLLENNVEFLYKIGYLRCLSYFVHEVMVYPNTLLYDRLKEDHLIDSDCFPSGYVFPKYKEEQVKILRDQLTHMKGELHSLERNDSLDSLLIWTIAYLDIHSRENTSSVKEILKKISILQIQQNKKNYDHIIKCLELCKNQEYNVLKKLCEEYSTEEYNHELKNYFLQLQHKIYRLKTK